MPNRKIDMIVSEGSAPRGTPAFWERSPVERWELGPGKARLWRWARRHSCKLVVFATYAGSGLLTVAAALAGAGLALVVYAALLVFAIVTGGGLGGPLAPFFMAFLAGVLAGLLGALACLPGVLGVTFWCASRSKR